MTCKGHCVYVYSMESTIPFGKPNADENCVDQKNPGGGEQRSVKGESSEADDEKSSDPHPIRQPESFLTKGGNSPESGRKKKDFPVENELRKRLDGRAPAAAASVRKASRTRKRKETT